MAERFGPALRLAEIEMLLKVALNKNTERATTVWLLPLPPRKEKCLAACSAQALFVSFTRRFDHRKLEWSIATARTWQQEWQSNDTSVS